MFRIVAVVEFCEALFESGDSLCELAADGDELFEVAGGILGGAHVMYGVLIVGVDIFVDVLVYL